MSIKINGNTLTDELIHIMRLLRSKSIKTGSEAGLTLCEDQKGNLNARNIRNGDLHTVAIVAECNEGEKFAGTYHTHPENESKAPASDLIYCGVSKHLCIGGETDNKIRCYTWKHNTINNDKFYELGKMSNRGIQNNNPTYQKNFECIKDLAPIINLENNVRDRNQAIIKMRQDLQRAKIEKVSQSLIKKV